jgi:4-methyl-5(b-hydroxyethyl)-thiazole monophosphate biosynthesis
MVVFLLANGFEESEAIVPVDLLRRAGVETVLASVDGTQVTSSHGITVVADTVMGQVDPAQVELLVIPGGLGGVNALKAHEGAKAFIRQVAKGSAQLAAICAGPTVLAQLGLVEGVNATCYPGMENEMAGAKTHPGVQVVEDGRVTTAESAGSAFEFGLKLVERLKGRDAAEQVAKSTCFHGAF